MRVCSAQLGITGACDVVEFHKKEDGVPLQGRAGLWQPFPIEYKRGVPKEHNADEAQLCAQAMCLEHMLCCTITHGALFYGETRRRTEVPFTAELRSAVQSMLTQMHAYAARGYTPKVKPHKGCRACSLQDICLPGLGKTPTTGSYLANAFEEVAGCKNC